METDLMKLLEALYKGQQQVKKILEELWTRITELENSRASYEVTPEGNLVFKN